MIAERMLPTAEEQLDATELLLPKKERRKRARQRHSAHQRLRAALAGERTRNRKAA